MEDPELELFKILFGREPKPSTRDNPDPERAIIALEKALKALAAGDSYEPEDEDEVPVAI
jgi:hypothetical protein